MKYKYTCQKCGVECLSAEKRYRIEDFRKSEYRDALREYKKGMKLKVASDSIHEKYQNEFKTKGSGANLLSILLGFEPRLYKDGFGVTFEDFLFEFHRGDWRTYLLARHCLYDFKPNKKGYITYLLVCEDCYREYMWGKELKLLKKKSCVSN